MKLTETTRRRFLSAMGAVGGFAVAGLAMPYYARGSSSRPFFTSGVQSGDLDCSSGVIWTQVDRPSRLHVEYSTTDKFSNAVRIEPIDVTPETDLAGKLLLQGLPADQDIFYRFRAADLQDVNSLSDPIFGQFRTAPAKSAVSASHGPVIRRDRAGGSTTRACGPIRRSPITGRTS